MYSSRDSELEDINLNEYVGQTMKTITDDQANRLIGLLTLEEISCTLKNMKNDLLDTVYKLASGTFANRIKT